jgi:hypothetical protein
MRRLLCRLRRRRATPAAGPILRLIRPMSAPPFPPQVTCIFTLARRPRPGVGAMAPPGLPLTPAHPTASDALGTVGEDALTRPSAPAPARRLGHARENPHQHFGRVGHGWSTALAGCGRRTKASGWARPMPNPVPTVILFVTGWLPAKPVRDSSGGCPATSTSSSSVHQGKCWSR